MDKFLRSRELGILLLLVLLFQAGRDRIWQLPLWLEWGLWTKPIFWVELVGCIAALGMYALFMFVVIGIIRKGRWIAGME